MQTVKSSAGLRHALQRHRVVGERIAFVPTMGNLHEGHLQLVRKARQLADVVVVSVFVNPMQFGANEDLDSYPRTLNADREKLFAEGADYLFAPGVVDIYPEGLDVQTVVRVPSLSETLCGSSRPGHFDGVSTVVSKLFNIVQPDFAVFGEKDFQQLSIIRKMVTDLCMAVEIVGVPTVRAEDGLALSGRGFGADRDAVAELVFNTSITGYQEILTDPSYRGQTVLLTQPHIGNYGVSSEDEESGKLWLSGLVVREACARASNFRSGLELHDYLDQHGVPGIEGLDTRMLTRRIRDHGEQRTLITRDMTSSTE